jgi:hypothetical protein
MIIKGLKFLLGAFIGILAAIGVAVVCMTILLSAGAH